VIVVGVWALAGRLTARPPAARIMFRIKDICVPCASTAKDVIT